jgi:hypothetical protein
MGALACKTKIILDSGNAAGYAQSICAAASALSDKEVSALTDDVAYPIIEMIITAEHSLEKAKNMLLDAVSYDGPRP